MVTIVALVAWLSLLKAAYSGALPALMAELFPTRTRGTGVALSYNVGVPIFGGFAPFVVTWLIAVSGSSAAPAAYLIVTSLLSAVALLWVRRRVRSP